MTISTPTGNLQGSVIECSENCEGIVLPYSAVRPFDIAIMMKDENGKILEQGHYIRVSKKGTIQTIKK